MEGRTETPDQGPSGFLAGLSELDRVLRGELTRVSSLQRGGIAISPGRFSVVIIILGMIYGICMGTFALFRTKSPHAWQIVASMVKVPLLFYLTLLVTLPSLYVFNALVGSRLTLSAVVGVMVAVLASLGPIVAFFSVSTTSYPFMLLFNVAVFTISGVLGLSFLLQTLHRLSIPEPQPSRIPTAEETQATAEQRLSELELQPAPGSSTDNPELLGTRSALDPIPDRPVGKHVKTVFNLWLMVFALVGAQMGWVLRPFLGNPDVPFTWFRSRESNFFQAVLQTFQSLFS